MLLDKYSLRFFMPFFMSVPKSIGIKRNVVEILDYWNTSDDFKYIFIAHNRLQVFFFFSMWKSTKVNCLYPDVLASLISISQYKFHISSLIFFLLYFFWCFKLDIDEGNKTTVEMSTSRIYDFSFSYIIENSVCRQWWVVIY